MPLRESEKNVINPVVDKDCAFNMELHKWVGRQMTHCDDEVPIAPYEIPSETPTNR